MVVAKLLRGDKNIGQKKWDSGRHIIMIAMLNAIRIFGEVNIVIHAKNIYRTKKMILKNISDYL